ncbi:hypothetical protein Goklo_018770 [Gossypium klotzschianum]|uniref:Uncharacterized protein n=1 Tax=Gossypium klotzschianum TaxID=34286 RepID=A0A7J8ULR7_9ROSI|nr:hypothetical protein [Gossypium klotzschianum]
MDSKVPSEKFTQELARELLIAISYSVPDTDPNSDHALKIIDGANGAVAAIDKAEKYRSELISISDTSPDAQVPPVVLGNHAGLNQIRNNSYSLPPGDMGWPLIGNMWSFVRAYKSQNPESFIGNLKRSSGWNAIGSHIGFGSQAISQANNEQSHSQRTAHIGSVEEIVTSALEECSKMKEPILFFHEMNKIAFNTVIASMEKSYTDLFSGLFCTPINSPGFAYHKAVKARKKLVKEIQGVLGEKRERKRNDPNSKIIWTLKFIPTQKNSFLQDGMVLNPRQELFYPLEQEVVLVLELI